MNDCPTCQQHFSDYLDQQLDPTTHEQLEQHLAACRQCLQEWEYFSTAVQRLRQTGMVPPPAGILSGVHRKLAALEPRPGLAGRFLLWLRETDFSLSLPTAAATVGIALVAMLIVRDFGNQNFSHHTPQTAVPEQTIAKTSEPVDSQPVAVSRPRQETAFAPRHDLADNTPVQPLSLDQHLTELHWQFMADSSRYAPRDARITNVSTDSQPMARQSQSLEESISNRNSFFHTFFQIAAQRPDVEITIKNGPQENRLALCRRLINSTDWMANVHDENTILLAVPPSKMAALNSLFNEQDVLFSPPVAREASFASPRKSLLVAVRLQ